MAISHNLATITDNLSGYDPVAGVTSNFGRDWVMWNIFDAWRTFDPRIKLITGSSPTPTWLQGIPGSLTSAPAQTANTTTANIRFYMSDDPGLSNPTPRCIIYDLKRTGATTANNLMTIVTRYMVSGGTLYTPPYGGTTYWFNETIALSIGNSLYCINTSSNPITVSDLNNIPKVIFWKNENTTMLMAISKTTGAYFGYGGFTYKGWTGYKNGVGSITEGIDIMPTYGFHPGGFTHCYEPISNHFSCDYGIPNTALNWSINTAGILPSSLLTFNSNNNLIAGKVYLQSSRQSELTFMTTNPLEGIICANSSAVAQSTGQIYKYNNKWYLVGNNMGDGRNTLRILFELGT